MLQYKKVLIVTSFVSYTPIDKNDSKICILEVNTISFSMKSLDSDSNTSNSALLTNTRTIIYKKGINE